MSSLELYKLYGDNTQEILVDVRKKDTTSFYGNTIVYCTGEGSQEYVAKFPTQSNHAKHEWIGYRRAEEAGVNVPDMIGLIVDKTGNTGILLKRVFGKNLYQINIEGIKLEFGSLVKRLHKNSRLKKEDVIKDFSFYDAAVNDFLVLNLSGMTDYSYIRGMLNSLSTTVAGDLDDGRIVFTHQDLHDDQVIFKDKKLYLIDFEEWRRAHPMEDIAIYLYHCLRTRRSENDFKEFVSGYVSTDKLTERDKLSATYFLLFQSLRMVDHYISNRSSELDFALQYLQRSVDYINSEKIWKL